MAQSCSYNLIDLFAGCGGMTLGFIWDQLFDASEGNPVCHPREAVMPTPFRSVWANDSNDSALETYRTNFDPERAHSVSGPINLALESGIQIPEADVVIGGPPCQGFSLLNKKRLDDERRELWWYFLEAAERAKARIVVMENVPQLLSSVEFEHMLERMRFLGYQYLMADVLCSANYGVPQVRNRAIVMASKAGPIALHSNASLELTTSARKGLFDVELEALPWVPVRHAIADLDEPVGTEIRSTDSPRDRLQFGRIQLRLASSATVRCLWAAIVLTFKKIGLTSRPTVG